MKKLYYNGNKYGKLAIAAIKEGGEGCSLDNK